MCGQCSSKPRIVSVHSAHMAIDNGFAPQSVDNWTVREKWKEGFELKHRAVCFVWSHSVTIDVCLTRRYTPQLHEILRSYVNCVARAP